MILFPNCKINIGLNITSKRNDGYHDLETVFYPIGIRDAIEVIEKYVHPPINNIQCSISGLPVAGDIETNLCARAYHLLKKDFPSLPAVQLHLHKAIPAGAGLGGGSADGAFTLKLLNKKFSLGLSENKLLEYAFQLGSDCAFFIFNKPCLAAGRGEILEPVNLDLSAYKILIVHPGIHISTAWAFMNIVPAARKKPIKEIITEPVAAWKDELKNDFEEPVFEKYPEIKSIKGKLYEAGAVYASMTGSGSAVYGIFEKDFQINLTFPENYFVKEVMT
jgi:4-diphosphocytidyl-2-C-methyl-D-erythritol kinase